MYLPTPNPHIIEAAYEVHWSRDLLTGNIAKRYLNKQEIRYFSKRYQKWVTVPCLYPSDGATGAVDVCGRAWWIHDILCDRKKFDDGTPCTNIQRSLILGDVLAEDGYFTRRWFWPPATWLWGLRNGNA